MSNYQPFSKELRDLLVFSKTFKESFTYESVKEHLKENYSDEMTVKDVVIVLLNHLYEAIEIPKFDLQSHRMVLTQILLNPISGLNPLGDNAIFGPKITDSFTVKEFYDNIICSIMQLLMLTNIGWCRNYLYPPVVNSDIEFLSQISVVRVFEHNHETYRLVINLQDDTTYILNKHDHKVGLSFDSSTYAYINDKRIGKIRMAFPSEPSTLKFIYTNPETNQSVEFNTGINESKIECYLDAEVEIFKYLFDTTTFFRQKDK